MREQGPQFENIVIPALAGMTVVRGRMPWARWLLTALLCLFATLAFAADGGLQPIPPFGARVTDLTGTLDAQQKQTLETQLEALEKSKGSRVAILLLPTTAPEDIAQYSIRVTDAWKLSRSDGKTHDGVLLIVAKNDHRVRIEVGQDLEGAIPDAAAARIIREYITPKFRAGDYDGGIEDAVGALTKLINDEPLPPPLTGDDSGRAHGDRIGPAVIAAWFAAIFLGGIFRSAPTGLRMPIVGAGAGVVGWFISGLLPLGVVLGLVGLFIGMFGGGSGGGFANRGGWGGFGGGGFGGGGFGGGGFGGGGFSGGSSGGFSGGGASGSW